MVEELVGEWVEGFGVGGDPRIEFPGRWRVVGSLIGGGWLGRCRWLRGVWRGVGWGSVNWVWVGLGWGGVGV